jgi:hypothetical protein
VLHHADFLDIGGTYQQIYKGVPVRVQAYIHGASENDNGALATCDGLLMKNITK